MPYVMVPVPEEHERDVHQMVLRLTLSAALNKWDPASVRRLLEDSSDNGRSVLLAVARGCSEGSFVSEHTIAELLGLSPNEVVELAMEVNAVCQANTWPALLLMKSDMEDQPDGSRRLVRRFMIGADPGRLVLDAETELRGDR